jgi:hypothetical protein
MSTNPTIIFKYHDPLNIRIDTGNYDYLKGVMEFLSEFVDNYYFMPKFKNGAWNGKVSKFSKPKRTFPYGLLLDVIKYTIKDWPDLIYEVEVDVKKTFTGIAIDPKWDLLYYPYDYQEDCIRTALRASKGIIRSATASGKSVMIAYITKTLLENKITNNVIIIVPNLSLIEQFKSDLIEYGMDEKLIGKLNAKTKQLDKPIVISTWQSLQRRKKEMLRFQSVIVDECLDGNTEILTSKGLVKIKDIMIGDIVISYNEKNKKYENDIVKNLYINLTISTEEEMYELIFDDGTVLCVTGNHKILTKNRGWVRADELDENDDIINNNP